MGVSILELEKRPLISDTLPNLLEVSIDFSSLILEFHVQFRESRSWEKHVKISKSPPCIQYSGNFQSTYLIDLRSYFPAACPGRNFFNDSIKKDSRDCSFLTSALCHALGIVAIPILKHLT